MRSRSRNYGGYTEHLPSRMTCNLCCRFQAPTFTCQSLAINTTGQAWKGFTVSQKLQHVIHKSLGAALAKNGRFVAALWQLLSVIITTTFTCQFTCCGDYYACKLRRHVVYTRLCHHGPAFWYGIDKMTTEGAIAQEACRWPIAPVAFIVWQSFAWGNLPVHVRSEWTLGVVCW